MSPMELGSSVSKFKLKFAMRALDFPIEVGKRVSLLFSIHNFSK